MSHHDWIAPEEHQLTAAQMQDLWRVSRESGMSRRDFVRLLAAGGSTAVLSACDRRADTPHTPSDPEDAPWVKNPAPFIRHPTNLETRLENLTGFLTPNSQFFVRNHAPTPRIDPAAYRLRVEGDAVREPVELSYDDLLRLPGHSVISYVECAGNWRGFYSQVMGQVASGGQWGTGAVGCSSWSGVSLGSILDLAGITPAAVDVNLIGGDEGEFSRSLPVDKATESDVMLAHTMNGEPLPPDHGFPVRAVIPGWVGSSSVKWLSRIVVSSQRIWGKNNTTSYVLIGPRWPQERYDPAQGAPITKLNVKSAIALPRPASLRAGPQTVPGFAHSPHGSIAGVEWREGNGAWQPARLLQPVYPRAWVRFEFDWSAVPGRHTLTVRATDVRGNTQPSTAAPNEKGYLLNVPLEHPVVVA